MSNVERRSPVIVVVDRDSLASTVEQVASPLGDITVKRYASVLEVVGDEGPSDAAGVVCSAAAAGPFVQDLLRWTDREHTLRIPTAVVGTDADEAAVNAVLGRDHVTWIEGATVGDALATWMPTAIETHDLRYFRGQHDALATQLREARTRLFYGDMPSYTPPEGPPCGPPLPTNVEEIQPLRDARAQFERGLTRAAVREKGSLKDASAALGISYTSLWRRLR